jgi:hypothetical protein
MTGATDNSPSRTNNFQFDSGFMSEQSRLVSTLKIVEGLCGTRHPESRDISEKLYTELTTKMLIRKEPETMELKLDQSKLQPNKDFVYDASIHPTLVKKRVYNILPMPKLEEQEVKNHPVLNKFKETHMSKLYSQIEL